MVRRLYRIDVRMYSYFSRIVCEREEKSGSEMNLHEPGFPVASTLSERLRCESFCRFGFLILDGEFDSGRG